MNSHNCISKKRTSATNLKSSLRLEIASSLTLFASRNDMHTLYCNQALFVIAVKEAVPPISVLKEPSLRSESAMSSTPYSPRDDKYC